MLRYTDTTVFNVGAQTIVNTINCVGAMGAGLALEFQLRFPEMEKDYVERCQQKKVRVGRPYLYKEYGNPWILNFPTKNHWKFPSKIEWIEQGLEYFSINYQRGSITSIAFPKLGCSNGGLEWYIVRPMMEKYLHNLEIDIFICEDTEKEASGTEGIMVHMLNDIERLSWSTELGMRADIKRKIASALPIYRFRDLRRVEGIGKQTYNDVFRFLYSLAICSDNIRSKQENEVVNFSFFEKIKNSPTQSTEPLIDLPQLVLLEEVEQVSSVVDTQEELSDREQDEELLESDDAFHILLPYIEKWLNIEKTKDEVADRFKLPKKLVGDWLKEAEKLGRIKKLSRRPTKYVAASSVSNEQLECKFTV
jgi:O-acetyl-ADP-ribose deacetylase (regulator of RNase III)